MEYLYQLIVKRGTIIQDTPTITIAIIDTFICPYLNAIEPKQFAPIKYPNESGINTVPNCHFYK